MGSECAATVPFCVVVGMMVSASASASASVSVLGLGFRPRFLGSGIFGDDRVLFGQLSRFCRIFLVLRLRI